MIKKGFTLIELIVVVAIIGILASVLTPNIVGMIDKAKAAKLLSVAKTLSDACEMYHMDTGYYANEYATPWYTQVWAHRLSVTQNIPGWNGPYLKSALSRADNPFNERVWVYARTNGWETQSGGIGFDLNGDGTVDISGGWNTGNDVIFYRVPPTVADIVETSMDGQPSYGSGRVEYFNNYYLTLYLGSSS